MNRTDESHQCPQGHCAGATEREPRRPAQNQAGAKRPARRKTMKQLKHWQDPVNALLGAWLALSPWVVGYVLDAAANYNAVVVGALLIAAALGAMFIPKAWEEWTEA